MAGIELGSTPRQFLTAQSRIPDPPPHLALVMPNNPQQNYPQQNHLLAALPAAAYKRLLPHFEPIGWDPGSVLCETGRRQEHVFFPTSALVSLLCSTQQGFMTN